jgi:hypothetical protein
VRNKLQAGWDSSIAAAQLNISVCFESRQGKTPASSLIIGIQVLTFPRATQLEPANTAQF